VVTGPSPANGSEQARRVAAFWNARQLDVVTDAQGNFLRHPLIHAYMSLRAFGEIAGQLDVVVAELRSRTRPGDRVLSVGCGAAIKELAICRQLPDRTFVAIDIAEQTIARVREQLAAQGVRNLELQVGDFNDLQLEPASYRAVLGLGAIHHVEALETFWRAVARGLCRDGCVIAQEYVGPNRMQWTATQIAEGNRVLRDLVPPYYCVHHTHVVPVPIETMIAADPSEAVRSEDLLPTCREAGFRMDGLVGAGCALLQPVLNEQIMAFDPRNWEDNLVLARLFRAEDELMQRGVLGDDFVGFVARPPA
jgi:2-polyprenyl-3-methyl-5-hydroxy-6-metoxy-1,4-benzoquinol methylase